ncbi:MAG: NAD-dependent epimerase/dehydratase family protein [Myxococcota bacterium]
MKILVTGGAGFIGSHLVDGLLREGHEVRVLDALEPQVHAREAWPDYLAETERIRGDIRDREVVSRALDGIDVVSHQAAVVGVGQSMYEIERYVSVNTLGAAVLLEEIVRRRDRIQRLVVASSMSIYGEGAYVAPDGSPAFPRLRSDAQLERREWDLCDPQVGVLRPVPTPEEKPMFPTSVYAVTKRDHEELFCTVGAAYRIPTVALRYFNVYGSRQALSNPYTGVAAIFSSRLLNGKAPLVTEDGEQTRDFVHVSDIVQANLLAVRSGVASGVFNVGTGQPVTIRQVAELLADRLGVSITPEITGRFRAGDIRHCYADIRRARDELGYEPKVSFGDGIGKLVEWVEKQTAVDRVEAAVGELAERGLTR